MNVVLRCSPDADDLFMMRALMEGALDTSPYTFRVSTLPTDQLNQTASHDDEPHVVALSFGHYPKVDDTWQLLPHGGSMGEGYGPVVVTREPMTVQQLSGCRIGIPGRSTTAWAVLQMIHPDLHPVVVPIVPTARIFDALREGSIDAGLVIHEGRLTYGDEGLHPVVDLGVWWASQTDGCPLPLGANAIRRNLGPVHIEAISRLLRASIQYSLEHREDSIAWILAKGSALGTPDRVSEYLNMYANSRTLDYGVQGRLAIEKFYEQMLQQGLINRMPRLDYAP